MSRERIRLQAAAMFAAGQDNSIIAKQLRVTVRSVQRWRQAWRNGGGWSLRSRGSPGRPTLSDARFAVLETELAQGATAHGYPDQTWTLARIQTLIGYRFHKHMSLSSISVMLRRHGWSHQLPARRALERDPQAVTGWVKDTWPQVKAPRRRSGLGWSSKTKLVSR